MLLCSNIAFRCLEIKVLTGWLLAKRLVFQYAENIPAVKVLVFHSPHRVRYRLKNVVTICKDSLFLGDSLIQPNTEIFPIYTAKKAYIAAGFG
jgi:hypothetical protein